MNRSLALTVSAVVLMSILADVGSPISVDAQMIPIRTVPVASGDQFLTLPAATLGMGGTTVAVDDALADPWSNPAKGVAIDQSAFVGSPTVYSISDQGGGGTSFPVAGMFTSRGIFGGVSIALQQIRNFEENDGCCIAIAAEPSVWPGPIGAQRLSDRFSRNLYFAAFVGTRIGEGPWSVGLSASASRLDAMDGVDLLYAGAERIEQSGGTQGIRLGIMREDDRERLALLLFHGRVAMEHDVSWVDWTWTPSLPDEPWTGPVASRRIERNEDRTHTWGAHVEWGRDLSSPGWRVGVSGSLNYKSHPKIPNYVIQNIPRDPGVSWAYEAAFGFSRTRGGSTFAVDVALQPIWSETWQVADEATAASTGGRIRVGDRSIENDFFFTNVLLRTGIEHRVDDVGMQFGLEARSYDYELEQFDHVERDFRDQHESWIEWTPSIGLTYRLADIELIYGGRVTTGTGAPGTAPDGRVFDGVQASSPGSDFILAPDGPLTLRDVSVVTHRLSIRIPVG